ncbi:MAG: hypothetical protein WCY19_01675 [Candidatus Gastranaerophilaceae bacterium]
MDKEILKLKVTNLIALRTNLTNVVLILSGGLASLFFLPNSLLKYVLIIIGGFYLVTFIFNLRNTIETISKILGDGKD